MYDRVKYTVPLTEDECELILNALEALSEKAISIGETVTIEGLRDKIK